MSSLMFIFDVLGSIIKAVMRIMQRADVLYDLLIALPKTFCRFVCLDKFLVDVAQYPQHVKHNTLPVVDKV